MPKHKKNERILPEEIIAGRLGYDTPRIHLGGWVFVCARLDLASEVLFVFHG
jgi:hypothetical protein